MQTVTLELMNEDVLNILKNLEKLSLIRVIKTKEEKTEQPISLAGSLSKESADLLRKHVNEVRNEWEREL